MEDSQPEGAHPTGTPDARSFGARLRHARRDRAVSQEWLASGICSTSAISRWEAGQSVPDPEVIERLADRLGIHVSTLTGQGFASRLAESPEGFCEIIEAAFGEGSTEAGSHIARWVRLARRILEQADPWSPWDNLRGALTELALSPLTELTPAAVESVVLFEKILDLCDEPSLHTVEELADALMWTTDAPEEIRRRAIELCVLTLVLADMPVSARGVVERLQPPAVSLSTYWVLIHSGLEPPRTARIHPHRSARDRAILVLDHALREEEPARSAALHCLLAACEDDGLIRALIGRVP
ncbi:helix-turn-helix domain-containing protein [Corynebacterium uropygiale]|uniref:Helix-turn-helix domain-containing protein n=1 Tax=Corynebacterium uropygiale TaxID=1775911 RepID=A0A9X1U897_9CORY|nr:helix-turn-helix transcriptional regulator [Corynebacterium uropygiale]MCF4007597.1 helix-turn-helix domain-containing protein [Corynebacterium uropygiale]